jgi:hypothetical protein
MHRTLAILFAAVLCGAAPAAATDVGLDLNLHLGSRAPAPIIVEEPPLFLVPPALGIHVAVGVPYEMFYVGGRYYCVKGGSWYVAPAYGGPWAVVVHDRLPPGLRKHKIKELVALRDDEYRRYRREREHYHGKSYRPERDDHDHKEKHGGKKRHGRHDD